MASFSGFYFTDSKSTTNDAENSFQPEDNFNRKPVQDVDKIRHIYAFLASIPVQTSSLNNTEPSVLIDNAEFKMPSKVILDHRFSLPLNHELYFKDTGSYICMRCFASLEMEEIVKHFFEKHGMMKDKFEVLDFNTYN